MPFLKSAPTIEQFVNDVKNLMLEAAARASAVFTSAKFQSDTFKDSTGINSGTSSGYTHRGASNYDVILNSSNNPDIQTAEAESVEFFSNTSVSDRGVGQVFTPATSYSMTGFIFKLAENGTPDMVLKGRLYATSAGLPTGAALAETSNINAVDFSDYATHAEYTFNFTTPYSVVAGTVYALVVERISGTPAGANNCFARRASSSVITGSCIGKSGADAWTSISVNDLYFKTIAAAPTSADIRAVTLTLPAAVTQIVMCADVTLNSGTATYYASTDGGSTWTTIALADLARIVSVPSGSQLVARVVLTGDAELEFLSIAAAA